MRITKKFLNDGEQKNVRLNKDYYNTLEIKQMAEAGWIDAPLDGDDIKETRQKDWRVYLRNCSEIDVAVDEFGYLTTVATLDIDGDDVSTKVYVEI